MQESKHCCWSRSVDFSRHWPLNQMVNQSLGSRFTCSHLCPHPLWLKSSRSSTIKISVHLSSWLLSSTFSVNWAQQQDSTFSMRSTYKHSQPGSRCQSSDYSCEWAVLDVGFVITEAPAIWCQENAQEINILDNFCFDLIHMWKPRFNCFLPYTSTWSMIFSLWNCIHGITWCFFNVIEECIYFEAMTITKVQSACIVLRYNQLAYKM